MNKTSPCPTSPNIAPNINEYVNGINIDFSDKNRAFSKIKNALEYKWSEYEIKRYFRAHFSINKIVKKICRILEK